MHSPPLSPTTTYSSITTTITITIAPLPTKVTMGVSLPQIIVPLSTPFFTDSTTTPTTTFFSAPEVIVTKSILEALQTSGIHVNVYVMGAGANMGVTQDQGT